jgi:DNA-binding helix-hairpin-helix protein with protein kinase domain
MCAVLRDGQTIFAIYAGMPCQIESFLGEGTQAEVYRATLAGKPNALKWYKSDYMRIDERLGPRLRTAIQSGPPTEKFLWPFDLVTTSPGGPFCGYVMALKEPEFVDLLQLLRRKVDPGFRILATVGLNLAHSFLELHTLKGLCYRDISLTNVYFDPETGDIRIGDNDNVDVNGQPGAIRGTPGFMAPEVDRMEKEPSRITDLHALAVLLFNILMIAHPLKGRKEFSLPYEAWDPDCSKRLYGTEPVFIFDSGNRSNEPVPGHHDAALNFWPIYPQFIRDLFTRAFTAGLRDPDDRPTENEWRRAMCKLRDAICICGNCGAENFYDLVYLRTSGGAPGPCWCCRQMLRLPPRVKLGNDVVMLTPGVQLFPHHLEGRLYDFSAPLAEVIPHPLGLRNVSTRTWKSSSSANPAEEVPPGYMVPLVPGMKIDFGSVLAEVRV